MYRVTKDFYDLTDKNHKYNAGDSFPRAGLEVSRERLAELSTRRNRRGEPLIEKVVEEEKTAPKKSGGKKKNA